MAFRRVRLLLILMAISFGLAAGDTDSKISVLSASSSNISPLVSELMKRLDKMERRHDDDVSILQRRIAALESQHASDLQQMTARDKKINSLENRIKHLHDLVTNLNDKHKNPMEDLNTVIIHGKTESAYDIKNISDPENENGRTDVAFDTHQENTSMNSRGKKHGNHSRIVRVAPSVNAGIAFHAILGHVVENPGIGQSIPFRNVITNIGNAYSSNTGVFRCTQTGVYVFSFTLSLEHNEWVDAQIRQNGHMITAVTCGNDYHWSSCSGTAIVALSQGDEVWVAVSYKPQSIHLESAFSLFSGFLLTYS